MIGDDAEMEHFLMPPPELYLALRERNNQESYARLLRTLHSAPATKDTQLRCESQPTVREAVAHCDEHDFLEAMQQLDLHYDDSHFDLFWEEDGPAPPASSAHRALVR